MEVTALSGVEDSAIKKVEGRGNVATETKVTSANN